MTTNGICKRPADEIDRLQREAVGEPAADDLRGAGEQEDEGDEAAGPENPAIGQRAQPLGEDLRQRHRRHLADEAGAEHGDREDEEGAHDIGARRLGLGLAVGARGDDGAVAHEDREGDAGERAEHARHDERRAPRDELREGARRQRRDADTETAENAVPAQRLAAALGVAHQPGDADRMIDRAEEPDEREPEREAERSVGKPGEHGGRAGADEIEHHHVLGAPAVAEPAGRQGSCAEQHVAGDRQRQELAVAQPEAAFERQHDGRVEQHQEMREEMPNVRERHREPG